MIFVTVGTDIHQFDRLIKAIDRLVDQGEIKDKVIAQIGNCDYEPKNFEYFEFKPYEEVEKLTEESELVISHGGAGSIMLALEKRKPLIVVPRLIKYNEHVNDHQMELIQELEKQGKLFGVYDISNLKDTIKRVKKIKREKSQKSKTNKIVEILENYVKNLNSSMR
jgi:UDP-N-acetylglucosamine transferase subunit ALG13